MISFIIIGKNIEYTIALCIESVLRFVRVNKISAYELLYVDSNSTDNTLKTVQQYSIRVLLLKGEVNSAVSRNVGVKHAKGDILFFIDGDMELLTDFYECVFDINTHKPKYPFINGYLCHRYYDGDFNYLYTREEKIAEKPVYRNVTGGLMIVERKHWEELEGMDERLVRNQDLDFGLRMAKNGIPALLDNHFFAIHHTINYFDKSRSSEFYLRKGLLSPGLLMRKHLFNPAYLDRYFRKVIYIFFLFAAFILLMFQPLFGALMILFYILFQLVRTIKRIKMEKLLLRAFLFNTLYSFYSMIGFLFYFPKKPQYHIQELASAHPKIKKGTSTNSFPICSDGGGFR